MSVLDEGLTVSEVSREEGLRLLDEAAQRYLRMSGEDFIEAWDQGRLRDRDDLAVQQVAMLLPFAR